jgi:hypothetical protein
METRVGTIFLVGCIVVLGLCGAGQAGADDIAWDLVSTTSQNLVSFGTDAPDFSSPGDGFQKYTVGVSESIPYTLVDDTNAGYPPDAVGVIDAATDFDEFFGVVDIVNNDNTAPLHATWVFDISSGTANLELHVDLAAMGDFEADDMYEWSYQVDGGGAQTFLTAVADEDGTMTYTMADGTTRDLDDPLTVNGTTLYNAFQSFSTAIPTTGSQLTVVLTSLTDGGSEGYVARNILVTAADQPPPGGGGEPIPTISETGIAIMVLLLIAGAVFLLRRRR